MLDAMKRQLNTNVLAKGCTGGWGDGAFGTVHEWKKIKDHGIVDIKILFSRI